MFVYSNLAISLDGKISTYDRKIAYLGTPEDRAQMQRLRAEADVILFGASTLRANREPALSKPGYPANAVVSTSLKGVKPEWKFFQEEKICRFLFLTKRLAATTEKKFSKNSEIIYLKPSPRKPLALQILESLKNAGKERILVEGGGELMWEFVKENLIDEFHVTLTPKLIGGTEAPTLVDGKGFRFTAVKKLNLSQTRVVGEEIFLIYRK